MLNSCSPVRFATSLLAICLSTGVVLTQTARVVPAGYDYEVSGGSFDHVSICAGTRGVRSMQVIAAPAMGFANETITHLQFRFSSFWSQGYASVQRVRLALGYTQLDPDRLPTSFASIPSSALVDVFHGDVSIPQSSGRQIPEPWSVDLRLQTPFLYDPALGNLVVELEASLQSGDARSWPADVHSRSPDGGGSQRLGAGCDGLRSQISNFGSVLAPGGNISFLLEEPDRQNLAGGAMLGLPSSGLPQDLSGRGAPNCFLRVAPGIIQPATIVGGLHSSSGFVDWQIPASAALVGLAIDHQVYMVDSAANTLGITLSTAHRVFIGAPGQRVRPDVNILEGASGATTGRLHPNPRGWILRFTTI